MEPSLTWRKLELADSKWRCVDAARVYRRSRMWYVSLNGCGHQSPVQTDTASLECDSQAGKLRTHPTNLLRRRELGGSLAKTRSSHGSYCEAWGPPLPLQGQYIPSTQLQAGRRCDLPACSWPPAKWPHQSRGQTHPSRASPDCRCVKQTSRHAVANLRMPSLNARYAPEQRSHRSLKYSTG